MNSPIVSNLPLSVRDVTVAYHRKPVLLNVTLDIPAGPGCLVGPNGAGKSTLLKAVVDMVPRISGQVMIFGQPYPYSRGRLAYVPQRESVDWDFRDGAGCGIDGNLWTVGVVSSCWQDGTRTSTGRLAQMEIDHLAKRQISQLSGGQQQRTFLARALVQQADLYLMDEPFARLMQPPRKRSCS